MTMARPLRRTLAILGVLVAPALADPSVTVVTNPPPADALAAQARLQVAPGLTVELWASEPLIQNPTSLTFDEHSRAYVVESHRRRTSVFDIRNFKDWVPDDLALRSVEDRARFLDGQLATNRAFLEAATKSTRGGFRDLNGDGAVNARDLEVESERIRLVWDANQDGKADRALTFADGFKTSVSGVAAGVLAQGSNVWFTCIPDLWRFEIRDREFLRGTIPKSWETHTTPLPPGVSGKVVSTGYGVHVAFGGHDLHGLIRGPDGRLYFSIADRGARPKGLEQVRGAAPLPNLADTGAIYRCEPDGSRLEVYAWGLRNPQELAFDEFGNLWTGDNNGDGGDKARWTLVLEGADYGWTIGWQWLPKMGAWNSERLWQTRDTNTAAYLVPPVAHIGHGPAGIAYYPGTGLSDADTHSFFYCDFPGGVRQFRVEPDGAFFRVAPPSGATSPRWMEDNSPTNLLGKVLWNLAPVDLAFPPNGGLVVADGFPSWEKDGKGRLWKVSHPDAARDPRIAETARLLAEGMSHRSPEALATLLGHVDLRVRLEAQWELAGRGRDSWTTLAKTAQNPGNSRARRHALWALGQIVRTDPGNERLLVARLIELLPLLGDSDPQVQIAAARLLGGAHLMESQDQIAALILNAPTDVATQAVWAYRDLFGGFLQGSQIRYVASRWRRLHGWLPVPLHGWFPSPSERNGLMWPMTTLQSFLTNAAAADPVARHAAVMLLGRIVEVNGISTRTHREFQTLQKHPDPRIRLTLALLDRRHGFADAAGLLDDTHPQVVLEAARAIHDVPIPEAAPRLAGLLESVSELQQRFPPEVWPSEVRFTRDEWLYYVLRRAVNASLRLGQPTNAAAIGRVAARPDLPEALRLEAWNALGRWTYPEQVDPVVGLVLADWPQPRPAWPAEPAQNAWRLAFSQLNDSTSTNVLVAAFRAGQSLQPPDWPGALERWQHHADPGIRAEVARLSASSASVSITEWIQRARSGPLRDRQSALQTLARSADPQVAPLLAGWLASTPGSAAAPPAELELDILEAARALASSTPSLSTALASWTNALPQDDAVGTWRPVLSGGDPAAGRRLFGERADWGCQRCHKLGGEGGDVGPDLTGVGRSKGTAAVLKAILDPNAEIAPGFENLLVTRKDGTLVAGVLKSETADALVLETPEDGRVNLPKTDIESRDRGLSAMPEGLADLMTLRELRDLIAALMESR